MNVNPIIIDALKPSGLPCFPNVWRASKKGELPPDSYYVFDYEDERPLLMAGDAEEADITFCRVHLFTRSANVQTMKQTTRAALRRAGFSVRSTAEIFENDTNYTHVIIFLTIDGVGDAQVSDLDT